jgi:hypothetical protein
MRAYILSIFSVIGIKAVPSGALDTTREAVKGLMWNILSNKGIKIFGLDASSNSFATNNFVV